MLSMCVHMIYDSRQLINFYVIIFDIYYPECGPVDLVEKVKTHKGLES